ncbi:MAG: hypothetical protein SVV67_09735 [Bacillota bacterium]|nr:hypothetical protein [Bacillota bacterium]
MEDSILEVFSTTNWILLFLFIYLFIIVFLGIFYSKRTHETDAHSRRRRHEQNAQVFLAKIITDFED